MTRGTRIRTGFIAAAGVAASIAWIRPEPSGMVVGNPAFRSLGQMAFGPGNFLSIGKNTGAQILAIEVANAATGTGATTLQAPDARAPQGLGVAATNAQHNELAWPP